jgi:hypothetical protein
MINGGYAYGHLFISQSPNVELVFHKLLSIAKPKRILEIGSMHGGLTLMLRDILDKIDLKDSIIHTYDINEQKFLKPFVIDRKVNIITKNLFTKNYSNFENTTSRKEIDTFIKQDGTSIVLCDGGCKKCEFNLIAPLLKINDIIMAHDYAPNNDFFNQYIKDKIWNWLEIQDSDVSEVSAKHNLIPFHQDLAQEAAWLCRIKQN